MQHHNRAPRYEIMWERGPTLPDVIAGAWTKRKPMGGLGSVARSLKETLKDLKDWSKEKFGNMLKEIERLRSQLEELQNLCADRSEIRSKMNQLHKLLYREEILWLQR